MILSDPSREQLRRAYREAWQKWLERRPLQPLEAQIVDVIAQHPEYHALLADAAALEREFAAGAADAATDAPPESANPFLHLGLHLALREQIGTDRPAGIRQIFQRLTAAAGTPHGAEHRMIQALSFTLREAQASGRAPEEAAYLERLRRL